jgi:hypothetical protein
MIELKTLRKFGRKTGILDWVTPFTAGDRSAPLCALYRAAFSIELRGPTSDFPTSAI